MKLQYNWEYGPVDYNEAEAPITEDSLLDDSLSDEALPDEEPEIKIEDDDEEKKEDEPKEDEEEEDPAAKLTEEEQDLIEASNPLSRKAIIKEFPEIFKKFPLLEKAMYGHQKYREIFPSVNDALEAQEKIETFEGIESELASGSFEGLLKGVNEKHPDSFAKLVDNYMPQLHQVNENAYYHVMGNMVKHTITQMANAAKESKDDDLLTAARILHTFAFGQAAFTPPQSFSKEKPAELTELAKEKEDYKKERFENNQSEVSSRVDAAIERQIDKYIDPKESMTPYARRAATKEAVSMVSELMTKDKPFQKALSRLWEQAQKKNYSKEELLKVRTAYLNKSNALLPHVIKKVRSEALKGVGRKPGTVDREGPVTRRAISNTKAGNTGGQTGKITKASEIPKGMSDLDFLNSD